MTPAAPPARGAARGPPPAPQGAARGATKAPATPPARGAARGPPPAPRGAARGVTVSGQVFDGDPDLDVAILVDATGTGQPDECLIGACVPRCEWELPEQQREEPSWDYFERVAVSAVSARHQGSAGVLVVVAVQAMDTPSSPRVARVVDKVFASRALQPEPRVMFVLRDVLATWLCREGGESESSSLSVVIPQKFASRWTFPSWDGDLRLRGFPSDDPEGMGDAQATAICMGMECVLPETARLAPLFAHNYIHTLATMIRSSVSSAPIDLRSSLCRNIRVCRFGEHREAVRISASASMCWEAGGFADLERLLESKVRIDDDGDFVSESSSWGDGAAMSLYLLAFDCQVWEHSSRVTFSGEDWREFQRGSSDDESSRVAPLWSRHCFYGSTGLPYRLKNLAAIAKKIRSLRPLLELLPKFLWQRVVEFAEDCATDLKGLMDAQTVSVQSEIQEMSDRVQEVCHAGSNDQITAWDHIVPGGVPTELVAALGLKTSS